MHSVVPCLVTGAQTLADRKWPGGGGYRGPAYPLSLVVRNYKKILFNTVSPIGTPHLNLKKKITLYTISS